MHVFLVTLWSGYEDAIGQDGLNFGFLAYTLNKTFSN